MAMNKQELIDYKTKLVQALKTDELALERVKTQVQSQRKMIELVTKQIESLEEEKPTV